PTGAATSWHSTGGNEMRARSGLSRSASRKISLMSLPQTPVTTGRTTTQASRGGRGSGRASRRVGPKGATKPAGEKKPAMRAAARRGTESSKETAFMRASRRVSRRVPVTEGWRAGGPRGRRPALAASRWPNGVEALDSAGRRAWARLKRRRAVAAERTVRESGVPEQHRAVVVALAPEE